MRMMLVLVALMVALAPAVGVAGDRQTVQVRAVSWFTARDGYGSAAFVNVLIDGKNRWTIKGDSGLDPGIYVATLDGDRLVIASVRDMKGKEHRDQKYRVVAHSWLRPVR